MTRPFAAVFTLAAITILQSCGNTGTSTPEKKVEKTPSFADARKNFVTKLTKTTGAKGEVETPPADLFSVVQYPTKIGNMPAYIGVVPDDGKLHAAMIWITGGFGNDIGDVWSEQDPENDQSAAVIGKAGIVMMYPAQRGGNTSPGSDESSYGEIDDILAAADFLAKQKGIDPKRIYLGGHSTGGTKVILAAEASNIFRAVFSLGPVASVKDYGEENCNFDITSQQESDMREPVKWLGSLQTPVFVFEGVGGNIESLRELRFAATSADNKLAFFHEVKNKDHFSAIQPVCKIIADKIKADDKGGEVTMNFFKDVEGIQ